MTRIPPQVLTFSCPGNLELLAWCLDGRDFQAVAQLGIDDQASCLAPVWSVQEACVKAAGDGVRTQP